MADIDEQILKAYRKLHNGISDMVEEGRLNALKQEDYQWIVQQLVKLVELDPA